MADRGGKILSSPTPCQVMLSERVFHPTQWTQVMQAQSDDGAGRDALSALCAAYYRPIIAFLRSEGRAEDAAQELAHDFFAQLLQNGVGAPDAAKGRFRNYLLGALKHFLSNRRAAESREKRGGGVERVALPDEQAAQPDSPAPEQHFDREWAFTLIARSLDALERENARNAAVFDVLKPWLDGRATQTQACAARALGLSETAVKVAIYRLRARFREILRAEIAATVPDESFVEDELRHLVAIASQG
jgi:DNA-directed RNA polymerase specialized sigma24 family protein